MTHLFDLPDEVLINILRRLSNIFDLVRLSMTCKSLKYLIESYDLYKSHLRNYPIVDTNELRSQTTSLYKIKTCLNWLNKKCEQKVFYSYPRKSLPHLQLDTKLSNDMQLVLADGNKIVFLDSKCIKQYLPTQLQLKQLTAKANNHKFQNYSAKGLNNLEIHKELEVFEHDDVKYFKKCDNLLAAISQNSLKVFWTNDEFRELFLLNQKEKLYSVDILSDSRNLIAYGCSNGSLHVFNVQPFDSTTMNSDESKVDLNDRILRTVFSPSKKNIAVGTAGIKPHAHLRKTSPLRILDLETFKEVQNLMPKSNQTYKLGAGVLALSYIDQNTLMSAGYDTFIRIFDLRTNYCIQSFEEPEDMSIYCVCCSEFNGLVSGNDRQSLIRHWDRRKLRIINTFEATQYNSSIYSLVCTTDSIYASWERGITFVDFNK